MSLNPQVASLLEMMAQAPALDFSTATVEEVRAALDQPMSFGEPPAVKSVRDLEIPLDGRTLTARLYVPDNAQDLPPLTLFYHGGGWVTCTLETHDVTCRELARASGSAILSVAYRLAPEHPYPAPVEDCYDSLVWAAANARQLAVDGARLAVAGDSAGGNLSAAVAIMCRDRNGPELRHQCLIYPITDNDFTTASYTENGGGEYFLGLDFMRWFWKHYLGDPDGNAAPLATILRTPSLEGLPPAMVLTAEYDPLRDEGMAYAARLKAAGVQVEAVVAPGMIHGFFGMSQAVPDAMTWIKQAGDALSSALRS
ncbi:MAG: alpha/beta hydrolase [Sphingorhabdus sp.]